MKISSFNYLMLGYISPIAISHILTSLEQVFEQSIVLKPQTKLDFSSDNPYLYSIPIRNIAKKFTIIRDLYRFLQARLFSSTTSDKKLSFPTTNHERLYKLIIGLITNYWKHLLRAKTSQKPL